MKKILLIISSIIVSGFVVATPVFAADCPEGCIPTAILGDGNGCFCEDDNRGSGVISILNMVVNIFTVAIGILAAVGIAITGTQYLTAGPNEEKTRKAKRRLIEIIIGVAAYVLIYSLLVWLLPGFKGFGG
jgi:cytochrome bd-type quinol oxidase subunit 2